MFKINPIIKFLLLVFFINFFFIIFYYSFTSRIQWFLVVFITIFILYLLWEVAVELDDPYHGIWRISRKKNNRDIW